MKKQWENEWFNIKFTDIGKISDKVLADQKFYSNFYNHFYKKYNNYNDLPDVWLKTKIGIAKDIISNIEKKTESILSIGCGIGYVENIILKKLKPRKFVALEPSIKKCGWMDSNIDFRQGYFPEETKSEMFDFVYACQIDYAMSNIEYENFLNSLYNSKAKKIMLAGISYEKDKPQTIVFHTKEIIKYILSFLKIRSKGQFWGYIRSSREHLALLESAGFNNFKIGNHKNCQEFWIVANRNLKNYEN